MFCCPEADGSKNLAQGSGFQPISADLVRGVSTGEWLLSLGDSTIVARHEHLSSVLRPEVAKKA
jgi:hypothetical protein